MALYSFSSQKMQIFSDGAVVSMAFLNVGMSRRKMASEEAEAGIVILEPNTNSTLVSGHSTKSRLCTANISLSVERARRTSAAYLAGCSLYITNYSGKFGFHEDNQRCSNKLRIGQYSSN